MSNGAVLPQPLQSLESFRESNLYSGPNSFVEDHPYPFLLIEIEGKLQNDTGGFHTMGLVAPNQDGSAPETVKTQYVAPVKKDDSNPHAFSMVTLGRSGNNDIVIRNGHISKVHCIFKQSPEGKYYVADPGSTNGTRIAGLPLEPKTPFQLKGNEELTIGKNVKATFYQPRDFFTVVWPE